ncbi:uncharacterized protein [Halyomorpha halys]|uniref:uncharacterized protein n=1 Tax=Halyomorpha halys TaxID=286706 RepID=UPI0006D4D9A1|nr:uncharacterized protein LOC106690177 [Halyomorpha halys]XP_014291007.1 uncharacterized protein LOC106690177 [Halyomorpha halys]
MQYKLELSLERMAMVAKAVWLWEQPHIKTKTRQFFLEEYSPGIYPTSPQKEIDRKWSNLTKEVLNQLDLRVLPKGIDTELIYVIRVIGGKIHNWYVYVIGHLGYNVDYAQQIYWSPYGNIDQVRIFKSFWLENSSLSTGNKGVDISNLFKLACNYVAEEHINNLWQQVPGEIKQSTFHAGTVYVDNKFHIIAYWLFYICGELHFLTRFLKTISRGHEVIYDHNHSGEENMFRLSVKIGYEVAAKYFWNKLNGEERDRNLMSSVFTAIKEYGDVDMDQVIGNHKRERYVDIFTFLINQIRKDRKEMLFEEKLSTVMMYKRNNTHIRIGVFKMFLSHWPYQEFFIPALERMWNSLNYHDYQYILHEIVSKIIDEHELGYVIENSRYQIILHETWTKSPVHFKLEIDKMGSINIIDKLLDIWDMSSVKLIVNDQDIVQRRQELIYKRYKKYNNLIIENKYDILDQFMLEILVSEEEKKNFKQKIDIWDYFIKEGQYDLADKLLDWQSDSPEERQIIKNRIDHISICRCFIKEHKYELADKFLNWQFTRKEDIKNCKNSFKTDKFSCDMIYKLWATFKEDIEIVKTQSLNFFNWFLDSEEEIALFKKEQLVNENLEDVLCDSFILRYFFEIVEEFLDWCLLSKEEIQRLKRVAVHRTIFRMCEYNLSHDRLDRAVIIVKWAFNREDKRHEFIKEFMLSDYGLRSYDGIIKSVSDKDSCRSKFTKEEKIEKFKKFIDFWIRPIRNLNELKKKLNTSINFYYFGKERTNNHNIFMNLLYGLERNHDIMEVS